MNQLVESTLNATFELRNFLYSDDQRGTDFGDYKSVKCERKKYIKNDIEDISHYISCKAGNGDQKTFNQALMENYKGSNIILDFK